MSSDIDEYREIGDDLLPHIHSEASSKRNADIAKRALYGEKYTELAREWGISAGRARQIALWTLNRAKRRCGLGQRFGEDGLAFADLSVRAKNILYWLGCDTPDDVVQKWREIGVLGFLAQPNCGRKTVNEIMDAFGLDVPAPRVTPQEYARAKAIVKLYEEQNETKT